MNQILRHIDWAEVMQGLSLSGAWGILTEKLIKLVEDHVQVSKVSGESGKRGHYVKHQSLTAIKKKHTKWLEYRHY